MPFPCRRDVSNVSLYTFEDARYLGTWRFVYGRRVIQQLVSPEVAICGKNKFSVRVLLFYRIDTLHDLNLCCLC